MSSKLYTPVGILSFPSLFEARAVVEGGDPRYSINIIFDAEAQKTERYRAMVKAIEDEANAFFQNKPPKGWRNPIRNAADKAGEYAGYEEGGTYIGAWSKQRPGLVGPDLEEILDKESVFAGQKVMATIKPFGYNQSGNKGVGLLLQNVKIVKYDMPRLDGRASATSDFKDVDDGEVGDDSPF